MEHDTKLPERAGGLVGSVLLERMQQQAEVRLLEDDWTGSTDATERRKRQNRLHQRTYRKRQKLLKTQTPSRDSVMKDAESVLPEADPHLSALLALQVPRDASGHCPDHGYKNHLLASSLTYPEVQDIIKSVERFVSQQRTISSPRADLLLTLIQFNVFRALFSNSIAIGFTLDWLTGDAISPFFRDKTIVHDRSCPASLRSTTLQRQVSHHPYIDLFPFPALRDNLFCQGEDFDDDDLCHDLVEVCHAPSERSGLIVWSNPWDPTSWEVTIEFIDKWPWMLRGCQELLLSTNYWRGKRGEEEIHFDVTPLDQVHY